MVGRYNFLVYLRHIFLHGVTRTKALTLGKDHLNPWNPWNPREDNWPEGLHKPSQARDPQGSPGAWQWGAVELGVLRLRKGALFPQLLCLQRDLEAKGLPGWLLVRCLASGGDNPLGHPLVVRCWAFRGNEHALNGLSLTEQAARCFYWREMLEEWQLFKTLISLLRRQWCVRRHIEGYLLN